MSLVTDLPAIFDQFSEARQKGFLTVMDLKERGIPLVGTYCTFMPQEIPMAAGAVVVSLCSTSDETIEEAEKDLPRNLCPLIKSSYGFGKTDKCPYFYFSDLVVGETTCDGKKKMYEYMAEFKPVHVMQLPNSVKDDASRALWKAEMLRLQKTVEERFGHEISEDALRDAIALKNRERRALANFYHLGQLNPPALSGSDILKVVYGATFRFDKEALINELDAMTDRVRQQWEEGQRLDPRPRILITGCPIGGAAEKVVRAIEENGGWVVGYENCTGAKATEQCVAETGDVYDALADKYLAIGCSCVSPNDQRLQMLSQMVEEYQVDGVVDVILQHTRHPFVLAALFSGVGIGIALGNEYVLAGLHFALSSQTLWQGAGALSGMMLIALTLLMPSKKHAIAPMPLAKTEQQIMSWWLLAILYGLAGFGYIIVATYLPLMAKDAGSPLLTAHLWTLVGLSIVPGCFGWLWAAKRWGALPCLTANLLVQAISVLLTLASDSPLLLIISSIGFGGTFMGTTSLVMTIARQLSVPGNLNLLGFVTLIYGIGQILGPALTSMLGNGTSALAGATLCGAAALFIAALISTVQLFKLQVVTS
ncbi:YbfB/YjiJ family MFS transporter [Escherichia coli]|nr:YbfB/YjiJ family MFS transporter [Escherichia coli]